MTIDPTILWQEQRMDLATYEPAALQARSRRLTRQIGQRNLIEYVAGGVAALFFVLFGLGVIGGAETTGSGLVVRAAAFLLVAGLVVMAIGLHRRGSVERMPGIAEDGLSFHIRQLSRQRDALAWAWLWYVGPSVPGMVLFYAGAFLGAGTALGWTIAAAAATALLFLGIVWLNRRAARRIDGEIAQLRSAALAGDGAE